MIYVDKVNCLNGCYLFCPSGLTATQVAGLDRVELRRISISVEEREKAAESSVGRKTEEEQRRDGLTPETNPVRQTVKNEMTVEERKREDGLTPEADPENKWMEEQSEDKITKTRNIQVILDSNKGNETISEERLTSETFSDRVILGEERRQKYSAADMVDDLDTDKEVEEVRRDDGLNMVTNSEKTETNEESRTVAKAVLPDNTNTLKLEKTVNRHNTGTQEIGEDYERDVKFKKSGKMEKKKQELLEEERESKLVAGISRHEVIRGKSQQDGEKMLTLKEENVEVDYKEIENGEGNKRAEEGEDIKNANHDELAEREKEDNIVVSNVTPPLSTVSAQLGSESEIPATIQIITKSPNPPPSVHYYNVPPLLPVTPTQVPTAFSHPPTPSAKVSTQFFPPSVTFSNPRTINHILASTVSPGKVKTVSLLEELFTEVLQNPGHHRKQNELEVKASPNLEDVMVKNILRKPARKETTHKAGDRREINTVVQPKESEFISKMQGVTLKPKEAKFTTNNPKPTQKSNENNSTVKPVKLTHKPNSTQPTGKPKTVKLMENDTKPTVKQNKASPAQPQLTKVQLTTAKTPSVKPMKINRGSKNKTIKKSKEKGRKKDNKTQKPSKMREVTMPTHFPYFMDNYCPPDCACYGR